MRKIRLGICGTGLCAQIFHLPALKKTLDIYDPVAVCSSRKERGEAFSQMLEIPLTVYTDWKAMVAAPEVEAILCSYPYFLSEEIVAECVRQKKHLLVEKPLCDNTESAKRLMEVNLNGSTVGVAENWIYMPAVQEAKKILASGEIGQLRAVYVTSLYEMELDSDWLTKAAWRKKAKGGMVLDRAVHQVAFERAVVGNVTQVCGLTQGARMELGETDTLFAVFQHENGVIGSLNVCASAGNLETDYGLAFIGTEGTLKIGGMMTDFGIHGKNGDRAFRVDNGDGGYEAELRDFHDAILEGRESKSSLQGAAMDVATILAPLEQPGVWLNIKPKN